MKIKKQTKNSQFSGGLAVTNLGNLYVSLWENTIAYNTSVRRKFDFASAGDCPAIRWLFQNSFQLRFMIKTSFIS